MNFEYKKILVINSFSIVIYLIFVFFLFSKIHLLILEIRTNLLYEKMNDEN